MNHDGSTARQRLRAKLDKAHEAKAQALAQAKNTALHLMAQHQQVSLEDGLKTLQEMMTRFPDEAMMFKFVRVNFNSLKEQYDVAETESLECIAKEPDKNKQSAFYFVLARIYYKDKPNLEKAVAHIHKAYELYVETGLNLKFDIMYLMARIRIDAGLHQDNDNMLVLEHALTRGYPDLDIHYYLAQGYFQRVLQENTATRAPMIQKAIQNFELSIAKNDHVFDSLFHVAQLYKMEEKISEAMDRLTRAAAINPDQHLPYLLLAQYADNLATAEQYILRAIQCKSDIWLIQSFCGQILYKQGKFSQALAVLQTSESLGPANDPVTAYYFARTCDDLFLKETDEEKAIQYLKFAEERYSKCIDAAYMLEDSLLWRAIVRQRMAINLDAALSDINLAISKNPNRIDCYQARVNILLTMPLLDEACAQVESDTNKIIALNESLVPTSYSVLGTMYFNKKDYQKSLIFLNKALESHAPEAVTFYHRAEILRRNRDFENAILDYTKAIDLNTAMIKSLLGRGICYQYVDQNEQALRDYEKILEFDPKETALYAYMAQLCLELNSLEKGEQYIQRAIQAYPSDPTARRCYVKILYKNNAYDKVIEQLEQIPSDAIDKRFDNMMFYHMYLAKKQYDKALLYHEKTKPDDGFLGSDYIYQGIVCALRYLISQQHSNQALLVQYRDEALTNFFRFYTDDPAFAAKIFNCTMIENLTKFVKKTDKGKLNADWLFSQVFQVFVRYSTVEDIHKHIARPVESTIIRWGDSYPDSSDKKHIRKMKAGYLNQASSLYCYLYKTPEIRRLKLKNKSAYKAIKSVIKDAEICAETGQIGLKYSSDPFDIHVSSISSPYTYHLEAKILGHHNGKGDIRVFGHTVKSETVKSEDDKHSLVVFDRIGKHTV